jgi:hypothetical protein
MVDNIVKGILLLCLAVSLSGCCGGADSNPDDDFVDPNQHNEGAGDNF